MKRALLLSTVIASSMFALNCLGQDVSPAEKTSDDPAFKIQGEYSGQFATPAGEQPFGIQVIALGDSKFQAVAYPGGLPGDGWSNQPPPQRIDGLLKDGKILFEGDHAKCLYEDGVLKMSLLDGTELGELTRVDRKSHTLGKKPPAGAVILFDGTSADEFVAPRGGKAQMTEDGLLKQGAKSKRLFADCHLHLEFRLPFEKSARGQQRGNSGVYLQGRYEVQMLDSFGLSGEHNECGGIYSVKKPDLNMCYPPMSWQTYDIDFTTAKFDEAAGKTANARMTIRHNGVLIHNDVEIPKSTTAAPLKEQAERGFLYLQDHGNQVRYRNIWLVEK